MRDVVKNVNASRTRMITIEVMIELIRAAVLDKTAVIPQNVSIDWEQLQEESANQGVLAWVWDGICKLPEDQQPPRINKINFGMSAHEIWDRYDKQTKVLSKLVEVSDQNNIRLLLLKGIGLSELYPRPQSRPSGDIDIFLLGDYEKGNCLFAQQGYHDTLLHSEFNYLGIDVENHKLPIYPNSKAKRKVSDYLVQNQNEVYRTDYGYYLYKPLVNLPYLMMHSLNHVNYASEGSILPLRHVIDIAMYIYTFQEELPPQKVFEVMNGLGLLKSFELFVYLSELFLNVDLSMYHHGGISKKKQVYINTLFVKNGFSEPYNNVGSFLQQSISLWKRYLQLKNISCFIPHKPSYGLLKQTLFLQKQSFLQSVMNCEVV